MNRLLNRVEALLFLGRAPHSDFVAGAARHDAATLAVDAQAMYPCVVVCFGGTQGDVAPGAQGYVGPMAPDAPGAWGVDRGRGGLQDGASPTPVLQQVLPDCWVLADGCCRFCCASKMCNVLGIVQVFGHLLCVGVSLQPGVRSAHLGQHSIW